MHIIHTGAARDEVGQNQARKGGDGERTHDGDHYVLAGVIDQPDSQKSRREEKRKGSPCPVVCNDRLRYQEKQ
jgi:hypothetical protein